MSRLPCILGFAVLLAMAALPACRRAPSASAPTPVEKQAQSHSAKLQPGASTEFFYFEGLKSGDSVQLEVKDGFRLSKKYSIMDGSCVNVILDNPELQTTGDSWLGTLYSASRDVDRAVPKLGLKVKNTTGDEVEFTVSILPKQD